MSDKLAKDVDDVLLDGKPKDLEPFTHGGREIRVRYWPMSWDKQTMIEDQSTVTRRDPNTGKMVLRREVGRYQRAMLEALVEDTNIKDVPGSGWRRMPAELAETILEKILDAEKLSDEEEDEAKNSSTPADPPTQEESVEQPAS